MAKMDENPDDHYLSLAAQGDRQAFGQLYTRYLDEIYRFVYFKVGSALTAEDITEETFIRTWERIPGIYHSDGRIDNLRAWLYRTANNLVIDFYRKQKPVAEIDQQEPGNLPFPEAVVVEHEQLTQITKALRELEPDYQQIIILRLVNELSHRDAAMIMKISEGHSRILLYRALRKLRTILDEKDEGYA